MKIGIFYGSSTGYTADIANRIAKALGVDMADVYDVASTEPSMVGKYDIIVLGCSTWHSGDMQDDMADFIDGLRGMYLGGKMVALFGCGDDTMSDSFCNGVGEMYSRLKETECTFIAPFNAEGYDYHHCGAIIDGVCVGLVLDDVNHPDLTDGKIADWTAVIIDIKNS